MISPLQMVQGVEWVWLVWLVAVAFMLKMLARTLRGWHRPHWARFMPFGGHAGINICARIASFPLALPDLRGSAVGVVAGEEKAWRAGISAGRGREPRLGFEHPCLVARARPAIPAEVAGAHPTWLADQIPPGHNAWTQHLTVAISAPLWPFRRYGSRYAARPTSWASVLILAVFVLVVSSMIWENVRGSWKRKLVAVVLWIAAMWGLLQFGAWISPT